VLHLNEHTERTRSSFRHYVWTFADPIGDKRAGSHSSKR